MTSDVNGQELKKGGLALLLCEIVDVETELVRIRIMNSEMELAVGISHDEVLGRVADSELTAFVQAPPAAAADPQDQVRERFE